MMNVNGENKNMENKNKRKPRMYLQPVPDDETREVPLWLLEDMIYCCVTVSGVYATDRPDLLSDTDKEIHWYVNESPLREIIEGYI